MTPHFPRPRLALAAALVTLFLPPSCGQAQAVQGAGALRSRFLAAGAFGPESLRFQVALPPSYEESDTARYPVVYFLPGFDTPVREYLKGTFQGLHLADLTRLTSRGFLLVVVDGDNGLGGGFYAASPAGGDWPRAIAEELVPVIDARYRTIAEPGARVLAGHSMGGTGALAIGLQRPDVFGHVFALSPGAFPAAGLASMDVYADDARGREVLRRAAAYLRDDGTLNVDALRSASPRLRRGSAAEYWAAFTLAYAVAFSATTTDGGIRIALPARLRGGAWERDSIGWRRFEVGFGGWDRRLAAYLQGADRLRSIRIEVGSEERWIRAGGRALSAQLTAAGLPVAFHEFAGGHNDRVRERLERGLVAFLEAAWP